MKTKRLRMIKITYTKVSSTGLVKKSQQIVDYFKE